MVQAHLLITHDEARRELRDRIAKGEELRNATIETHEQLNEAKRQRRIYTTYNQTMLGRMFNDGSIGERFARYDVNHPQQRITFEADLDFFRNIITEQLTELESILESLDNFRQAGADVEPQREIIGLPEKITLKWLWHYVPIQFWLWLLGIIAAVFVAGIIVGQLSMVQELVNRNSVKPVPESSPSPSPSK